MNRLGVRIVLVSVTATLIPLAATLWLTSSLLDESLRRAATRDLDSLSKVLERTGKQVYQHACDELGRDAASGRAQAAVHAVASLNQWDADWRSFWLSGEPRRFVLAGPEQRQVQLLVRMPGALWVHRATLPVSLAELGEQYRQARAVVGKDRERNLRQGFQITLLVVAAALWAAALVALILLTRRTIRPIRELTGGLARLSSGDLSARVAEAGDDEVGTALRAFNDMAARLRDSQHRLIYLAQAASWQSLARKMAHELKNSLTPIRLTVEEMVARSSGKERAFLREASQIVVEEIESLERRVRAFSEFSAEPPVHTAPLDVNGLLEERVKLLSRVHGEVSYSVEPAPEFPSALADEDLLKGILTNLLENAAQAAGAGGRIVSRTARSNGHVWIEVHDSGPGLSEQAASTLFQPSISFKKDGMGLGLSIARKNALMIGGDLQLVKGELGGAGFRVLLPAAAHDTIANTRR